MKRKIILAILVGSMILLTGLVNAFSLSAQMENVTNIKNEKTILIPISDEDFKKIETFIKNIKDEEQRKKAEELFNLIITEEDKIDISVVEKLTKKYFDDINSKIGDPSHCVSCEGKEFIVPQGSTLGTSTVFEPPYSSCFSWGHGLVGGSDDYMHSCNKYSGAIGAYASAWVGGATAEAMQSLNFYVGRTKTVYIDAEILRTGGKSTVGIGAFAGTDKSWSWDDFQANYHKTAVDPWWTWDDIIVKIINMVALLSGMAVGTIKQAIEILGLISNFYDLFNALMGLYNAGDAEFLYITFSFSASPGYHTIWTGLRANAGACVTGTGVAVTAGQVKKITIDGIAAPDNPTINGPNVADVGVSCQFSFMSNDPNSDKVQFLINWGDGQYSDWTSYVTSGTNVYLFHTYNTNGKYTIKALARDIDLMESGWSEHVILVGNLPPEKPLKPIGLSNGVPGKRYPYFTTTTDPDGDQIYYLWSWGDGSYSNWLGPYESGEETGASHVWTEKGTYQVKVKAKDSLGAESEWSDPISVNIPKDRIRSNTAITVLFEKLFLFLQVFGSIRNH